MTDELLYERLAIEHRAHALTACRACTERRSRTSTSSIPLLIAPVFRHGAILARLPPGARAERVRHELGRDPCVPARSSADLERRPALRRRRGDRDGALDHALVVPPDRGRRRIRRSSGRCWRSRQPSSRPSVRTRPARSAGDRRWRCSLARSSIRLALVLPARDRRRRARRAAAARRRSASTSRSSPSTPSAPSAALALVLTGHSLLGTYSQTANGNPLPPEILESAPAHVAVVALAGGLIPFLVGGAWAVSNLFRIDRGEGRAFAWLTVVTVVVLTVEVASFDLRFGGGLLRERYLFYITPLLLCAFAAALSAPRLPRWSLLVPLSILDDRLLARAAPRRTRSSTSTHRRRCSTTGCSRRCTAPAGCESRSSSLRSSSACSSSKADALLPRAPVRDRALRRYC